MSKIHRFGIFAFLCCSVFLGSCDYDPVDRYRVDIKQLDGPPQVTLNININSDTVYFNSDIPVKLKITTGNLNIQISSVKLKLDNVSLGYELQDSGYYVNPFKLNPGIHKFKIEFYANSGTTSIADKMGAEVFQYQSREFTFMVHTTDQPGIVNESESVAGLTLNWYTGLIYRNYKITKLVLPDNSMSGYCLDTSFFTDENRLFDPMYIGERARYSIFGLDAKGNPNYLGIYETTCKFPKIRVIEYQGKLAICWKKNIHYENIASLELYDDATTDRPIKIASLNNTDTVKFLDQSYFGLTPRLAIRYIPKYSIRKEALWLYQSYFNQLIQLPGPYLWFPQASNCSEIFYRNNDSIYGFSAETFKTIFAEPLSSAFAMSPDTRYILKNLDLYTVSPYKYVSSIQASGSFCYNISLSNIGVGMFNTMQDLQVWDFSKNKLITSSARYSYSQGDYWSMISPNGKSLMLSKSVNYPYANKFIFARIQNKSIIPVDSFEYNDNLGGYGFMKNDSDYFYYYGQSTLFIRQISNLTNIRTIYTGDNDFGNIDFCTDQMITKGTDAYHIYSIITGNIVGSVPLQKNYYFYLLGKVVFFDYGNKFILSN